MVVSLPMLDQIEQTLNVKNYELALELINRELSSLMSVSATRSMYLALQIYCNLKLRNFSLASAELNMLPILPTALMKTNQISAISSEKSSKLGVECSFYDFLLQAMAAIFPLYLSFTETKAFENNSLTFPNFSRLWELNRLFNFLRWTKMCKTACSLKQTSPEDFKWIHLQRMWESRHLLAVHCLIVCLIQLELYEEAAGIINDEILKDNPNCLLGLSLNARVRLHQGFLSAAEYYFGVIECLGNKEPSPIFSSTANCLLQLNNHDLLAALNELQTSLTTETCELQEIPSGDKQCERLVALNNLAVALVYSGNIQKGTSLLEDLLLNTETPTFFFSAIKNLISLYQLSSDSSIKINRLRNCFLVCLPNFSCGAGSCYWIELSSKLSEQNIDNKVCFGYITSQLLDPDIAHVAAHIKQPDQSIKQFLQRTLRESHAIPKKVKQRARSLPCIIVDQTLGILWNPQQRNLFHCFCDVLVLSNQTMYPSLSALPTVLANTILFQGPLSCVRIHGMVMMDNSDLVELWLLSKPDLDIILLEQVTQLPYLLNGCIISILIEGFCATFYVSCLKPKPCVDKDFKQGDLKSLAWNLNTSFICSPWIKIEKSQSFAIGRDAMDYISDYIHECIRDVERKRIFLQECDKIDQVDEYFSFFRRVFFIPETEKDCFLSILYESIKGHSHCIIHQIDSDWRYKCFQWYRYSIIEDLFVKEFQRVTENVCRLGSLTPQFFFGRVLLDYCRYRLRTTVDSLMNQNSYSSERYCIVLLLNHIEYLSKNEWIEVETILKSWIAEVNELLALHYNVLCFIFALYSTPLDQNKLSYVTKSLDTPFNAVKQNFQKSLLHNNSQKLLNETINMFTRSNLIDSQSLFSEFVKIENISNSQLRRIFHALFFLKDYEKKKKKNLKWMQDILPELQCVNIYNIFPNNRIVKTKKALEPSTVQLTTLQSKIARDLQFYIFWAVKRQDFLQNLGFTYYPRALLSGPSGSGKSFILKYLQTQNNDLNVCITHITSFYSPYVGETENRLQKKIKEMKVPGIFILEGLELLARNSVPYLKNALSNKVYDMMLHRKLLITLLLCLDGFDDLNTRGNGQLGFIGVSCIPPEALDASLTRPGRLDRWFTL